MVNNSEREFYYEYYCKQYRNDKEALEELQYLYDNFKDFDFTRFCKGQFKKAFIEAYGVDLTFKAAKKYKHEALEYGLKNSNNLEKIKYYLQNDSLIEISDSIITDDIISLSDLKQIEKLMVNPDMASVFKSTIRNVPKFKEIINNSTYLNNFEFIANYFEMFFVPEELFNIVCEPEFTKFIKNIDESYITTRTHISDFLKIYKLNKKYFKKDLCAAEKEIVNNYAFNSEEYNFILDANNIMEFYNLRDKNMEMYARFMQPIQLKDFISKVYFNRSYNKTIEILEDTKVLLEKNNIKDEKFDYLYNFKNLESNEELVQFTKGIKNDVNIANKLITLGKKLSKEGMSNKLSTFLVVKGREVIKLTGEEFYMLVHKIKGFGNQKLANELYQNPSVWTKNYEPYSYISTSAISDKHLGICDGSGYVLGFNNIKPEYILAMGPVDILTDVKMVKNDIDNLKTRYMDPDDLIDKTKELYNEVVLKRYIDKEALLPDFVVTIDGVKNKDNEVSRYFDIPIYDIDSKCYANKMIAGFEMAVAKHDYKTASKLLLVLAKGFNTCSFVRHSYLNLSKLEGMINKIVYNHLNSNDLQTEKLLELLELVKTFDNVVNIISFMENSYVDVNTNDAKNAVLNKLKK